MTWLVLAALGSQPSGAAADEPQFGAESGTLVTVETDSVTGETVRTVQGGYSISADGTTITGTLPPGDAPVAHATEADPLDHGFAKRFAKARNRSNLKRYSPKSARRSVVLTRQVGCVWNVLTYRWFDRYIDFNGWMTDCGYGTLKFNVWTKYVNSRTGKEEDLSPRAYYGTTTCYSSTSCAGASHSADAPKFGNGTRDLVSRTHGWRVYGGDDTAWTYADYTNN